MVPRSGASPDPTIPPLIFVLFLSCISSPHNILTFLYGRMRIDRNTWQIKGEGVFMAQVSREKRLFTYKGMSEELDPVNIRLLEELQCNPRLTMSELGRRIGMSSPAVTERVRRLEEMGVIRGYSLELNPTARGLPITAYVRVRPSPGQLSRVAELARQTPEVVECHRVTGEDCFIIKVHIPA